MNLRQYLNKYEDKINSLAEHLFSEEKLNTEDKKLLESLSEREYEELFKIITEKMTKGDREITKNLPRDVVKKLVKIKAEKIRELEVRTDEGEAVRKEIEQLKVIRQQIIWEKRNEVLERPKGYQKTRDLLAKILKLERKNFNTALIKILKKYWYHREKKERINYLANMYYSWKENYHIKKMKKSLDKDDKIEFYEKWIEIAIINWKPFDKQLYNEYINFLTSNQLRKLADTIKKQKRKFVYERNIHERDEFDVDTTWNENINKQIDNMDDELKEIHKLIKAK